MNKLKRIDFLFRVTGLLALAVGLLFFRGTFELAIHDTYLIIDQTQIALAISFAFLLFSLIYFSFSSFSRPLKHFLGIGHYLLTTLPLLILVFPPLRLFRSQKYTPGSDPFNGPDIYDAMVFIFFIFAFAQFIFVINIIWTLLGRNKKSNLTK